MRDERGTATLEFVMVFPVALFVMLILLQTMLMMSGNLFVHYAAYIASRVAIVQAPQATLDGGGRLVQDESDPTYNRIHRAAAFALTPVSGQLSSGALDSDALAQGLHDLYASQDIESPNWIDNLSAQRLNYAMERTRVTIMRTEARPGGAVSMRPLRSGQTLFLGPKDPVSVGVGHRLNLSIPYASALFADGTHATADGSMPYADITATSTLTLEGIKRTLPEAPMLERDP